MIERTFRYHTACDASERERTRIRDTAELERVADGLDHGRLVQRSILLGRRGLDGVSMRRTA